MQRHATWLLKHKLSDNKKATYGLLTVVMLFSCLVGTPAWAACVLSTQPDYVDNFEADPRSLLRVNPRGGDALAWQIRGMATASTASLKAVASLIAPANPQQKDAIGLGLARASGACSARSPEISRRISDIVRLSGDRDLTRSFTRFFASSDDKATTANSATATDASPPRRVLDYGGRVTPQGLPLGDPFAKP